MFKFLALLFLYVNAFAAFGGAASCDGIYDLQSGVYSVDCAALYVSMTQTDYSFLMGFSGLLFGVVFMFSMVFVILNTGRSWRV